MANFSFSTTVTIASSASLSDAVNFVDGSLFYQERPALCGIIMPGTWTTADLTFQASEDGSTFNDLYDELGAEVTVTAAASRYIRLSPADWARIRHLKVRSGTSGSAVAQGGDRTITLLLRPV